MLNQLFGLLKERLILGDNPKAHKTSYENHYSFCEKHLKVKSTLKSNKNSLFNTDISCWPGVSYSTEGRPTMYIFCFGGVWWWHVCLVVHACVYGAHICTFNCACMWCMYVHVVIYAHIWWCMYVHMVHLWKAPEKWKAHLKNEKHKKHLKSEKHTSKVKNIWKAHLKCEKYMKSNWKVTRT